MTRANPPQFTQSSIGTTLFKKAILDKRMARCYALFFLSLFWAYPLTQASDWLPISEEELTATSCYYDPDSPAEFLYVSILSDDQNLQAAYRERYFRLKFYDESAISKMERIHIPYFASNSRLRDLRARVIKADGTIKELDNDDIYSQTVSKDSDGVIKKKSFSLPDIEPGDIFEYKYKILMHEFYYSPQIFLEMQNEWPTRKIDVKLRPTQLAETTAGFKWTSYKCNGQNLERGAHGFFAMQLKELPAFPEEPYQLSMRHGKAWTVFYHAQTMRSGKAYWDSIAKELLANTANKAATSKEIKAKAKEILKTTNEDSKLEALYNFCRTEIINSHYAKPEELSPENRKKLNNDSSSKKILKMGYGTPNNLNILFCALAKAAGYDARLCYNENLNQNPFLYTLENRKLVLPFLMVAIKEGDNWIYCDAGEPYYDFSHLPSNIAGGMVLIGDSKADFKRTPVSDPFYSKTASIGDFTLNADGSLAGQVDLSFLGHDNNEQRKSIYKLSEQERLDRLQDFLQKNWPNSTVSEIKLQNTENILEPLKVSFEILIPQYAESIGSRLVLTPSIFRKNQELEFPDETRETEIKFKNKFNTVDEITISLPENFKPEDPSSPKSFSVPDFFEYTAKLQYDEEKHQLVYSREHLFSVQQLLPKHYKPIKGLFDKMHAQDQHNITLKNISDEL